MFIKNQTFKDEETLLEMLFDFSIGQSSVLLQELIAGIDKELENNTAYQDYYNSLQDADDRAELYTEERDMRLSEQLMQMFEAYEIHSAKLYGLKDGVRSLLYEIDLH